jgi:indole-3-glycerol phosphate synthase
MKLSILWLLPLIHAADGFSVSRLQPRTPQNRIASRTTTGRRIYSSNPRAGSSGSRQGQGSVGEDLFAAVHRKEYEMKQVKAQHVSTTDPVRMAMSYAQESATSPMRLAKALRRVYDDVDNPANPNYKQETDQFDGNDSSKTKKKKTSSSSSSMTSDLDMRRGCFIVDIKRKSALSHFRDGTFCNFDDAGMVAQAMVRLGADAVFVNTDYHAYGGDMSELKSAVQAVQKVASSSSSKDNNNNRRAAVVMKDIVVDEIQLGLAKEAGADGIVLMSSVLGPALDSFLDLATVIGLETIVECHTRAELERALDICAPNIMINNFDRVRQEYHPQQAIQLAGLFPGSGGPIICLATGGIETVEQMKRHLAVGYDGVVVGKAVMGSPRAPEFIRAVRDQTLLPAELAAAWGLENVEFDVDGNAVRGQGQGDSSRARDRFDPSNFQ